MGNVGEMTPADVAEVEALLSEGAGPAPDKGKKSARPDAGRSESTSSGGSAPPGSAPIDDRPAGGDRADGRPGALARFWAWITGKGGQWESPKDRRQKKAVVQEQELAKRIWGILLDGVAARAGDKWKPTNRELDALSESSVEFVNSVAPAVLEDRMAQVGLPLILLAYVAGRVDLNEAIGFVGKVIGGIGGLIFGRRKKAAVADPGRGGHGQEPLRAPDRGGDEPTRSV